MPPSKILTTPAEIAKRLPLSAEALHGLEAAHHVYPLRVTEYYLSLARSASLDDPILRQCLPHPEEISPELQGDGEPDPLAEEDCLVAPRLVHRYPDRVLFVCNNCCATRCRHCLRKRHWCLTMPPPSSAELAKTVEYLQSHPEVREVLVSGGDPLMMSPRDLGQILTRLSAVDTVEILRVGTRIPVTDPGRLSPEYVQVLRDCGKPVWVATHFNHPWELTSEAGEAVALLVEAGIPVVNQTVLLKGVNDDPEILRELFTGLLRLRVKPYYLFHGDPVQGAMHFRTGIDKGLALLDALRGRVSGLALPAFAFDLPGGKGKIRLEAEDVISRHPDAFRSYDGQTVYYR